MPVIPSFSFSNHRAREHQGNAGNPTPPDHARGSPQPPPARPSSNPSPRLSGPVARTPPNGAEPREGTASPQASTSDASLVDRAGSRATSRSDSVHSTTTAVSSSTSSRERRSDDVALFTAAEAAVASPGRRFTNLHRRARRERARSATPHAPLNDTDADDAAATGASLRRTQYTASASVDAAAEMRLSTSDSALRSAAPSSDAGSARNRPAHLTPRADITILVAPPSVQLTTAPDARRRHSPHSAPTSERVAAAAASSSAASSSVVAPATPVDAHGHGRSGGSAVTLHAITTSAGWQRTRASTDDVEDASRATFPADDAAAVWQLPVLTTTQRGHAAHPYRDNPAPSPRYPSHPSWVGREDSVESQRRSASNRSTSRAGSQREISWVYDDAAANTGEGGRRGLSRSVPSDFRVSSTSFGEARSNASAAASTFAGNRSDTHASLLLSQPLSSIDATTGHRPSHPRITREDGEEADPRRGERETVAEAGDGGGHYSFVDDVMAHHRDAPTDHAGLRSSSHDSRPASPLHPENLLPAAATATLATPVQVGVSPQPVAAAGPTDGTVPSNAVHLPTATDGVVLLNHLRNVPAHGELYRLLRVFHREPLEQFPQALRGPPLAVRLPGECGGDEDGSQSDPSDAWNDGVDDGAPPQNHRQWPPRSRSRGSASRSASLLDHADGNPHHHRGSRSLHSSQRGRTARQHSHATAASSSRSSSSSRTTVAVNAGSARELFARLVSDPADRAVEVRGLPSTPSSALSTSPRRSRRSRANLASTADRSLHDDLPGGPAAEQRVRSAFSPPTHRRWSASVHSGQSLSSTTAATASTFQAEVVANGFFSAEVRREHAQNLAEAAGEEAAEYGEGCYYTLPLIPISASPTQWTASHDASATTVSTEAVMTSLPRLHVERRTSSRIQRGALRASASAGSGTVPRSTHVANSNDSAVNRENVPPSQLSPEPPRSARVRSDMVNPRSTSAKSLESVNAANATPSTPHVQTGPPQQIRGTSPDEPQASRLNEQYTASEVPADEYAPMARANFSACTSTRRSSNSRKSVDKG